MIITHNMFHTTTAVTVTMLITFEIGYFIECRVNKWLLRSIKFFNDKVIIPKIFFQIKLSVFTQMQKPKFCVLMCKGNKFGNHQHCTPILIDLRTDLRGRITKLWYENWIQAHPYEGFRNKMFEIIFRFVVGIIFLINGPT